MNMKIWVVGTANQLFIRGCLYHTRLQPFLLLYCILCLLQNKILWLSNKSEHVDESSASKFLERLKIFGISAWEVNPLTPSVHLKVIHD